MCGIFALLNYLTNDPELLKIINERFMKGSSRGPEFSKLDTSYNNLTLGFHRLAINGLNDASNQPLVINNIVLICNGEIYNYKHLYDVMGVTPTTGSDCEVIIHTYLKYGIEHTLNILDGVFAFVLYDTTKEQIYVARDPLGVRPLYMFNHFYSNPSFSKFAFASELKCLEYFHNDNTEAYGIYDSQKIIRQFTPGTYSAFKFNSCEIYWDLDKQVVPYFTLTHSHYFSFDGATQLKQLIDLIQEGIAYYLNNAVTKRCLTTERPIACLLSGGLDSSLITALVNNYYVSNQKPNRLETYSIGLLGSEDLKYAKIAATYLDTNHTEIIVTEQLMFETIPEVIKALESYDTTTIRASLGNFLLGKFIAKNSQAKVIFNGDGSDELLGGYLYMNKCPDSIEFDKETRRLLKDIHLFDVLRSDKSISSHGLEPRTPFLDKSFVNYVLSIPPELRNHKYYNDFPHAYSGIEKFILRYAFSEKNFTNSNGCQILPDEILWRKKEAFSDGVSTKGRSLYQILQEKIAKKMSLDTGIQHEANIETEKLYYKQIFDSFYPNCQHIVPYYWMPKYTNATDPSARTLDLYV
jgi:asparagine synthase (glutamine-hydrolysing)